LAPEALPGGAGGRGLAHGRPAQGLLGRLRGPSTHSPPDGGGITPHRVPRRTPAELSRQLRGACTLASGPQPRPRHRLTHRREIAGRIALLRQDAWVVLFQEALVLRGEPLCHRVQVVHVPPLRREWGFASLAHLGTQGRSPPAFPAPAGAGRVIAREHRARHVPRIPREGVVFREPPDMADGPVFSAQRRVAQPQSLG